MNYVSEMNGSLSDTDIIEIFSMILKSDRNTCSLKLIIKGYSKEILIKKNKITFIYSDDPGDTFYKYIINNSDLEESDLKKADSSETENRSRLGKALVELGLIDYEQLWAFVREHQEMLLENIMGYVSGEYSLDYGSVEISENIELNISIEEIILERIRNREYNEYVKRKFEIVNEIFIKKTNHELPENLKPYEKHVLDLCIKYRDMNKILNKSELKEADTLRYIYYFRLINILSTEKVTEHAGNSKENYLSTNISFSSYEEALKHYNIKFEMIYKILSKEIGPVATSILSNSIDDIRDNLPVFLKGAEIDKNGKLLDKKILKKVWYHEFENHSSEFVRGLEELLYAQIFSVKKNLGIDYENQILKWLKGIGN